MDITKTAICADVAEKYKVLLDRIPVGKLQAISMKSLADSFGMDIAELKEYILRARIDGCFIISGQNGYYLPETLEEMQHYVIHRRKVIKTAELAIMQFQLELSRIVSEGSVTA